MTMLVVGRLGFGVGAASLSASADVGIPSSPKRDAQPSRRAIWEEDIPGNGFRSDVKSLSLSLGGAVATYPLGGLVPHDMVLGRVGFSGMLGEVIGGSHWYRGNFELMHELFGGMEYSPETHYVIGAATLVRYNFATGTRWVPFLDAGAGVAATDIGRPDLGSVFEFNLQFGAGVHYFFRDDTALTMHYRLVHLCNAGIERPNQGINESTFYLGLTWFF